MRNTINYTSKDGEFSSTSWKLYEKITGKKPFRYVCNECGCSFYTTWHSVYSMDKVKCPICEETTDPLFITLKSGDLSDEDDLITDFSLESLKALIDKSGDLDLSYCDITELPEGLEVPRTLNIEHTNISSLPSSLKVGGGLWASYTKITSIPQEFLHIHGDLVLCGCNISSLPDGLTVDGSLYLDNSNIKQLPNGLTIGWSLYIENTAIEELPSDMKLELRVYAKSTHLKRLNGFSERYITKNY